MLDSLFYNFLFILINNNNNNYNQKYMLLYMCVCVCALNAHSFIHNIIINICGTKHELLVVVHGTNSFIYEYNSKPVYTERPDPDMPEHYKFSH